MTTAPFEDAEAPRGQAGSREPTALGRFIEELAGLRREIEALQRGSQLRNASISGGEGLRILDDDGTLQAQIAPDRTVTVFDEAGEPVVRMGNMQETDLQEYGIEVRIGDAWIQLGAQAITWENVGNKPGWAGADTIAAGYIAGAVSAAAYAETTGQADGVTPAAFAREVAGVPGSWYAMYMHSNGTIGRATSSLRYKRNVRQPAPEADPLRGLRYQPVTYDRKAAGADDYTPAVSVDELGLIAEEVAKINPQLVTWYGGKIDSVRYELVALELIPVLRNQEQRIAELEKQQAETANVILEMKQKLDGL